jgi:hypothetical protein
MMALMDAGVIKVDKTLSSSRVPVSVSRTLLHVVSKCEDLHKFLNISPWAIKRNLTATEFKLRPFANVT